MFVEIDVGQGRCGVPPGRPRVDLAHEIRKHPALRFAGLQAYHGRAQHVRSAQERRDAIAQSSCRTCCLTRKLIEAEGIPVDLVTGAGTGSMVCEAASGVFGELQAGSFLFMDADYAANERDPAQPQFEHALFVKTQVISSRRAPCGLRRRPQEPRHRFGPAAGATRWTPTRRAGISPTAATSTASCARPAPASGCRRSADMLWLIPGHCDPTVNLHDHLIGVTRRPAATARWTRSSGLMPEAR